MTLTLNAVAVEKISNRGWLSIFNKTFTQNVNESVDLRSGSFVKQIASSTFPIFLVVSYTYSVASIGLRILGFDVPLKSYKVLPDQATIPIDWKWNGFSLKGTLALA